MGILRSVALGKSRKSAGDLTFYTRIGVACFRQKPALSPGYKATVPQRMQQKVFQFMKRNIDASGVKAFIDNFLDAKAKSGRSETKMNIFYRNYMPHLVAQKAAIYELADDEMVDNAIFLGTSATNSDKLTSGVLGELTLKTAAAASITMDATILDAIIQKANEQLSAGAEPFTTNTIFLGFFGAASDSETDYVVVPPTNIVPALADGVYTFTTTTATTGIDTSKKVYVAMLIAGTTADQAIDVTRRKFATNSASF